MKPSFFWRRALPRLFFFDSERYSFFGVAALFSILALSVPPRALAENSNASTGLWVGEVSLFAVSEAASTSPNEAVPTGTPFRFPIIIHTDDNGSSRLLKQGVILWKADETPARYRLFADFSKLPEKIDSSVQDARRISTSAIDFEGASLEMKGKLKTGGELTATVLVERDLPTNPFRHAAHPDHDDLDPHAQVLNEENAEVYAINRSIQMAFSGQTTPNILVGKYREEISGLHHQTLVVEGTITLRRITRAGVLE